MLLLIFLLSMTLHPAFERLCAFVTSESTCRHRILKKNTPEPLTHSLFILCSAPKRLGVNICMTASLSMFFEPLGSFLSIQAVLSQDKRPLKTRKQRLVTLRTANAAPTLSKSIATENAVRMLLPCLKLQQSGRQLASRVGGSRVFGSGTSSYLYYVLEKKSRYWKGTAVDKLTQEDTAISPVTCFASHVTTPRQTA